MRLASRESWFALFVVVVSGFVACGSSPGARSVSSGDAAESPKPGAPDGGWPGDARADVDARAPGDGPTGKPTCDEAPPLHVASGVTLTLRTELAYEGRPLTIGQPNKLSDGTTLSVSSFRAYLSNPTLVGADGKRQPVDFVGADGKALPYGVHFVNAQEPAALTIRLLVPSGTTASALSFMVGLSAGCNTPDFQTRRAPLDFDSQMTWPHLAGYLYLKYEGAAMPAGLPPAIHVGGQVFSDLAPVVTVPWSVAGDAGPGQKTLRIALDQLFKGAKRPIDPAKLPSGPLLPGDEIMLGEALRQHLAEASAFTIF